MDWAGEFTFGSDWAAFRGRAADNRAHAHTTAQLVLTGGLDAVVRRPDGSAVRDAALLVRPGVRHALAPLAQVTLVFLEPQTALAQAVDRASPPGDIAPLAATITARIDLAGPLHTCLDALTPVAAPVDPRLTAALAFLATSPAAWPIGEAAAQAGISTARLRVLARAQLGVPLATWLAWRRLARAGQATAGGAAPAEAALAGGFSDQAHFTRAMRKVFGVTPGMARPVLTAAQSNRSRRWGSD